MDHPDPQAAGVEHEPVPRLQAAERLLDFGDREGQGGGQLLHVRCVAGREDVGEDVVMDPRVRHTVARPKCTTRGSILSRVPPPCRVKPAASQVRLLGA